MRLGFTCDPQHVFAFAPNCTLLKVHIEGVYFSQYLNLIIVLVVFKSFKNPPKFLDFSALWVRILKLKTFFDGRPIERARQAIDFSTHE